MTNPIPARNKYMVCVGKGDASRVAVRLACARGKKAGRSVELLHVVEPPDFQALFAVTDKLREERRQEAENLLNDLCALGQQVGVTPSINLREGVRGEEIVKATLEDPDVSLLILGVEAVESSQSRLVTWLVGRLGGKLLVPVMLIPGNLTDQQLEELT